MNRKAALLVMAVFVLGLLLGGLSVHVLGDRVWAGRKPGKMRLVQDLTRELSLSPDQQQQVVSILEETNARYQPIFEQIRPQLQQVREEGRNRIRAILTQEQRPRFEEFLRRIDEERKKKNHR